MNRHESYLLDFATHFKSAPNGIWKDIMIGKSYNGGKTIWSLDVDKVEQMNMSDDDIIEYMHDAYLKLYKRFLALKHK